MNDIETLSERLGSLQIIEEALNEYKQIDTEMSTIPVLAPANENIQTVIPKSMVPDPGWFDRNQTKFEDW